MKINNINHKKNGPLKSIVLSIISAILAGGVFFLIDSSTLATYGLNNFISKAIIIFAYILFIVFAISSCGNLSIAVLKFVNRKKNK